MPVALLVASYPRSGSHLLFFILSHCLGVYIRNHKFHSYTRASWKHKVSAYRTHQPCLLQDQQATAELLKLCGATHAIHLTREPKECIHSELQREPTDAEIQHIVETDMKVREKNVKLAENHITICYEEELLKKGSLTRTLKKLSEFLGMPIINPADDEKDIRERAFGTLIRQPRTRK